MMNYFIKYFEHFKLALLLVGLFVIQNQIFNISINLSPNPYLFSFLVGSFTLGVLLYTPAILLGKQMSYIYFFLVSLIISFLFISQYLYFSFFGGFFQISAIKYVGQVSSEWSTILTLLSPVIFLFCLNFFIVLTAFVFEKRKKHQGVSLTGKERIIVAVIIVTITSFGYLFLLIKNGGGLQKISSPMQTLNDLGSNTFSPNYAVQEVGIGNYFLSNIIGTQLRNKPITNEDKTFVIDYFSQKSTTESGNKYFGLASGKNLFFIQVESLESAVIGQKINNQEITPNLNKLLKEGLYFDNYYTQVGPGNTADVEFVTLNSLYPLINEVAFIDYPYNTYDSLPNILIKNNYHTYSLHGDVESFWNRVNIYPALGYQQSINKNDFTVKETGFETLSDNDFLSQSIEKIKTFPQPFMATLITLTSHTPFIIPEEYQKIKFPVDSTLSDRQKNYLESIHYTDNALGIFIDELKKNGLYDNSLIAIYGDHGSTTNISGQLDVETEDKILESLRPNRVPLILLYPKLNSNLKGTISTPGSHLDLYPTIANLLGITLPKSIFGQDLLNTKIPIMTRRDPYSEIITSILTPNISYESAASGVFIDGTCLKLPIRKTLLVDDCKDLYDNQLKVIKVSDLVIKGNLISDIIMN